MKRTLAIALSTLALAATAAQAQAPQPSFVDYVAIETDGLSRNAGGAEVTRAFPQPSFVDYAAIEAADKPTVAGSTVAVAQGFPKPSFSN